MTNDLNLLQIIQTGFKSKASKAYFKVPAKSLRTFSGVGSEANNTTRNTKYCMLDLGFIGLSKKMQRPKSVLHGLCMSSCLTGFTLSFQSESSNNTKVVFSILLPGFKKFTVLWVSEL